jgi:GGDEF domain-containing protein
MGADEEKMKEMVEERMDEIELSFLDKRYETPNREYLQREMFQAVDKVFDGETDYNKTRNVALINFDLNGLKSVNDLSGHQNGDKYLQTVVEVFRSGKISTLLDENGIKPFFATYGGDEFAVLLNSDIDLTSEEIIPGFDKPQGIQLVDWITAQYQEEIFNSDCGGLVDFSNPAVQKKFKGIKIPNNFKYRASVSGGCVTLADILLDMDEEERERILSLDYDKLINNLVGGLFDASDRYAMGNKIDFKLSLEKSPDENDNFLAILYKRTDEAVRLSEENRDLHTQLTEQEKIIEQQKARIAELELQLAQK